MNSDYRIERWKEVYAPNPAMLRLQLVNEGYRVFQWSDQPNCFYASHAHSETQSHWIVSGQLEINVEFVGRFVLGPGDRDFMPANAYHTAKVLGTEPVVYLVGEKLDEQREKKPKNAKPAKPPTLTKSGKPRKKRMTKAEKAAADAEFEAIKKMFGL